MTQLDLSMRDHASVALREAQAGIERFLSRPLGQIEDKAAYLSACVAIIEAMDGIEREFAANRQSARAESHARKLWRKSRGVGAP